MKKDRTFTDIVINLYYLGAKAKVERFLIFSF